jgi:hypothetical protein
MALVDNQNDRPVSGNQRIISRMCVMIVNTHWASKPTMAFVSVVHGGLAPPFPFRPFVLACSSLQRQPSALSPSAVSGTGRVLAWKYEIVPSIARSSHCFTRGCWQGWNHTWRPPNPCLSALASSKSLGLSFAAFLCSNCISRLHDCNSSTGRRFEILPIVVVVAHRHDSTVLVSLSLEMTMTLRAGLSSPEMAAE